MNNIITQDMTFKIFTDGASRGNPGNGGYGAVISDGHTVREIGGHEDGTTNNRMEIMAAVEALKNIPTNSDVEIFTDSAYLLNGATKWIFGWIKNNWQTSTKEDVLNQDLWEELAEVIKNKRIKWHKLSGHAGVPANERCDVIATSFADNKPIKLFNGDLHDYKIDLTITDTGRKNSSKKGNTAKAYSYVSLVNGKISIDKTWAECEARVKGVSGARFKKAISREDEEEIIRIFKTE